VRTVLSTASESSSVVVVGFPGAGKSGVLHDFAQSSIDKGSDVIFIAVDQMGAKSLGNYGTRSGSNTISSKLLTIGLRNVRGSWSSMLLMRLGANPQAPPWRV
jgi:ABC-type phosphate/phosphonate transport system ATPase subunit